MPNYEPKPVSLKQREFLIKWLGLPHSSIDLIDGGGANMLIQSQTAIWNAQDRGDKAEEDRLTVEMHRTLSMVLALAIEAAHASVDESDEDEVMSSEEVEWIES